MGKPVRRRQPPHTRGIRPTGAILTLALLAAGVWLGPVAPASADPIADKKAQAAALAKVIESKGEAVSKLAEAVNQARLRAGHLNDQLGQAQAAMEAAERRASAVRARMRDQVVASYVRGGAAAAVPAADPEVLDVAVQRTYVSTLTAGEKDVVDDLRAVHLQVEEERTQLASARQAAGDAVGQVTASQRAAAQAVADEQAALAKVQGDLAGLVAVEAQRLAEQQAAQARTAAAARQAADQLARSRRSAAPPIVSGLLRAAPGALSVVRNAPAELPVAAGAAGAVEEARRQIGKPYVYGAAGPNSFDCSGLIMWAWGHAGVSLPHSAAAQYTDFPHVPMDSIQPGDILAYGSPIHHDGLYIGGGQMIEASHTGTPVRYASIYRSDLVGASRP